MVRSLRLFYIHNLIVVFLWLGVVSVFSQEERNSDQEPPKRQPMAEWQIRGIEAALADPLL